MWCCPPAAARAAQTAEAIAGALGLPVAERTCDLCEQHPGPIDGMTNEEAVARFGYYDYAHVPGAEPFSDWLPGEVVNLHQLAERFAGQSVVAATHNGVVKASFAAFGNMPLKSVDAIKTPNTGITEWLRETGTGFGTDGVWQLGRV